MKSGVFYLSNLGTPTSCRIITWMQEEDYSKGGNRLTAMWRQNQVALAPVRHSGQHLRRDGEVGRAPGLAARGGDRNDP
jgi:hypothetical protein